MPDLIRGNIEGMYSGRRRVVKCRSCAQPFEQRELSKAFGEYVARMGESVERRWKTAVPENALPVFCLRCERRDLAFDSRTPFRPTSPVLFAERAPSLPGGEPAAAKL